MLLKNVSLVKKDNIDFMKTKIFFLQTLILVLALPSCDNANKIIPEKAKKDDSIMDNKTEIVEETLDNSIPRFKGTIPPPPNDNANDFPVYDVKCLISKSLRDLDENDVWYGNYLTNSEFQYGIITNVSKDLKNVTVVIVKADSYLTNTFGDLKNTEWQVELDQTKKTSENQMSADASTKLPQLMVPGRRIKFTMVEGYPGGGTASNGVWSFTYIKALIGDDVNFSN
jgi:hypothetical protein